MTTGGRRHGRRDERRSDADANAVGFVVAGRPERIEDGLLAAAPGEFRERVRRARGVLAHLAFAEAPAAPSPSLRAKVLASIGGRVRRSALVVVDMIHDHLDEGALLEVPRARGIVPALEARIASARTHGMPIVYVVDEHDADDPDLDAWGTHALKGSRGAEVWDTLAPAPGDHVVRKPSYSAFFQSSLAPLLETLAVDRLILTGCLTEIGLTATATDAMQLGYDVSVPVETQAGAAEALEQAALTTLRLMVPFGPARKARLAKLAAR